MLRRERHDWTDGPDRRGRYHDSRGRLISRENWNYALEELRARGWHPRADDAREVNKQRNRRKARISKGELSARRPTEVQRAQASRDIALGKEPKSIKTRTKATTVRGKPVQYEVFRFEGLQSEQEIRKLLRTLRDSGKKVLTALNVGTGYGKRADWIGSPYDIPQGTLIYLDVWQSRPSAATILASLAAGSPLWFELEVIRVGKYSKQPTEGKQTHAKKKKSRYPTRS